MARTSGETRRKIQRKLAVVNIDSRSLFATEDQMVRGFLVPTSSDPARDHTRCLNAYGKLTWIFVPLERSIKPVIQADHFHR